VTVYRLSDAIAFPDPEEAEDSGLLAVGGDLRPERLILAYSLGIFPCYEKPPILWFSPDPRAALVPAALHVPRRLARTLRAARFEVRLDTAFAEVIDACARTRRRRQRGTWITEDMQRAYCELHRRGLAHSAEAWHGDQLVGGVYGVSLGGAFFGESMFHRQTDAGKVALVSLIGQLARWGFELFDCQQYTAHVARLGASEWPRRRFLDALARALRQPTRAGRWRLDAEPPAPRTH
jgi:leucyl/phenylalanyl-tRNA--protein transferase